MYSSGNIDLRNWVHLFESRCIIEEIKSRLKSGIACYLLVHNLLSFSFLSKNIRIHRTVIFLVFCMVVKLALILMEELRLKVFKNNMLSKIFIRKRVEVTGCITKSCMFCPTHEIPLGWRNKKEWVWREMWHVMAQNSFIQGFDGENRGKEHS